jgi:hypothetical protein
MWQYTAGQKLPCAIAGIGVIGRIRVVAGTLISNTNTSKERT